jgi:hypothetical protein
MDNRNCLSTQPGNNLDDARHRDWLAGKGVWYNSNQ